MKMQNAEMEFVSFDAQDVIATSGELTFTVAGLGNRKNRDATIVTSDGRTIYNAKNYGKNWGTAVAQALNGEVEGSVSEMTQFYINSTDSNTISDLFNASSYGGDSNLPAYSDYNGIYKWISDNNSFMKQ